MIAVDQLSMTQPSRTGTASTTSSIVHTEQETVVANDYGDANRGKTLKVFQTFDDMIDRAADAMLKKQQELVKEFEKEDDEIAYFNNVSIMYTALILIIVNVLGFIIAGKFNLDYDRACTVTCFGVSYVMLTLPTITAEGVSTRCQLSAIGIFAWAVKFIISIDANISNVINADGWPLWVMLSFICLVPHIFGLTSSDCGNITAVFTGAIMAIIGLLIESIADIQKWACINDETSFCDNYLWSTSQNPHLFGNILFWVGIFVLNQSALIETVEGAGNVGGKFWGYRRLVIAFICGPLLVSTFHLDTVGFDATAIIPTSNLVSMFMPSTYTLPTTLLFGSVTSEENNKRSNKKGKKVRNKTKNNVKVSKMQTNMTSYYMESVPIPAVFVKLDDAKLPKQMTKPIATQKPTKPVAAPQPKKEEINKTVAQKEEEKNRLAPFEFKITPELLDGPWV